MGTMICTEDWIISASVLCFNFSVNMLVCIVLYTVHLFRASVLQRRPVLEFLNNLWGLGTE
jgi:hypothetical protein